MGEVNYYLTQFLTGHGYFLAYLYKMRKLLDPSCAYGNYSTDDILHTFIHCKIWHVERENLQSDLGMFTLENIIQLMLQGKEEWAKVCSFIDAVFRQKQNEIDATAPVPVGG